MHTHTRTIELSKQRYSEKCLIWNVNFIQIHHNIAINITFGRQCSNILLFGITRLRLTQERIFIFQCTYLLPWLAGIWQKSPSFSSLDITFARPPLKLKTKTIYRLIRSLTNCIISKRSSLFGCFKFQWTVFADESDLQFRGKFRLLQNIVFEWNRACFCLLHHSHPNKLKCSGDLNTGLVLYSKSRFVSGFQMVQYLKNGLITRLWRLVYGHI